MKMVRNRAILRYLFDRKYEVSLSTMEACKGCRAYLPGDGDNYLADGSKNREGERAGIYRENSDTTLTVT